MDKYFSQLNNLFSQYKEIKLVYLFGSQAKKKTSPLSDYDFAVYLDKSTSINGKKDILLELNFKLSLMLKTNNIDVVILNKSLSPLLQFNIVKDGILIYEKDPYRLLVESEILSYYFDFQVFKKTYNI